MVDGLKPKMQFLYASSQLPYCHASLNIEENIKKHGNSSLDRLWFWRLGCPDLSGRHSHKFEATPRNAGRIRGRGCETF